MKVRWVDVINVYGAYLKLLSYPFTRKVKGTLVLTA